jgi:hypothetical protein
MNSSIWTRRDLLKAALLTGTGLTLSPQSFASPHIRARAKRLIFIFLTGGCSHVDGFDPKPALKRDDGKSFDKKRVFQKSPWAHRPYGQSGLEVTDLFKKIAGHADDLAVIRSLNSNFGDHAAATLGMHTGSFTVPMPGIGAWLGYGLGSMNQNLPHHMVLANDLPYMGAQNWDAGFLPNGNRGVLIQPGKDPIPHLKSSVKDMNLRQLEDQLLKDLNQSHADLRGGREELLARKKAYKIAQALMKTAPEVFNTDKEPDSIKAMYGAHDKNKKSFAWQCLLARRLIENDCRMVELVHHGAANNWDNHSNLKQHESLAREIDQPVAALITDLKQRGLLEDTLVVLTTEFGRSPAIELGKYKGKNPGREHHSKAFTVVMAGGGVKGGTVYGESDEHGQRVAKNPVSVHDLHATILDLMGLNHEELVFRYSGRDFRLTDVYGDVITGIVK